MTNKMMMMLFLAASLGTLGACAKSKAAGCADLERDICAGKDGAFCERAKTELWNQTGPDRKPMTKEQVERFCTMMSTDKDRGEWVQAFQKMVSAK